MGMWRLLPVGRTRATPAQADHLHLHFSKPYFSVSENCISQILKIPILDFKSAFLRSCRIYLSDMFIGAVSCRPRPCHIGEQRLLCPGITTNTRILLLALLSEFLSRTHGTLMWHMKYVTHATHVMSHWKCVRYANVWVMTITGLRWQESWEPWRPDPANISCTQNPTFWTTQQLQEM